MRKPDDLKFSTSVPDFIVKVRWLLCLCANHPALPPLPWPNSVPSLQAIDEDIAGLERAYQAFQAMANRTVDERFPQNVAMGKARRKLKNSVTDLVEFIQLQLAAQQRVDVSAWPGFDLSRNPGGRRPRGAASCTEWCRGKLEEITCRLED